MDYSVTAKELISKLGGEKNINSLTHCMTRLRFILADESVVDDKAVENIPGVIGIMKKGGQYQVIIGNNVAKCYAEINKITSISESSEGGKTKEKKNPFVAVIDLIAGCMTPMIPVIIAGGLIKVLLVILGPNLLNLLPTTSDTYVILNGIGDTAFYFLPVFFAYFASKKLGCNSFLAMMLGAMLIHPDIVSLLDGEASTTFLGFIPVIHGSYASSLIPALLSTILLKYVEILVDKITPEWSKNFLKPMLIVLIAAPVTLCLLAPLGLLIGEGLQFVLEWIYGLAPWLAMAILTALMPLLVMTGMHWAFMPAAFISFSSVGYEFLLSPAMLAANIAQAGACFGVAVKTRDSKLRQVAIPAGTSALLAGVTEPAMYGVTLKLKKPMIAAMIAGGVCGVISGIVRLAAHAMGTPCLTSMGRCNCR